MLPDDTREAASRLVKKRQEVLDARYGNYQDNLNILARTIYSIIACFELNSGTADEVVFPLLNMFRAIENKDHGIADMNTRALQDESSKLPEHIRLSVDAQIESLNAYCRNMIDYRLDRLGGER